MDLVVPKGRLQPVPVEDAMPEKAVLAALDELAEADPLEAAVGAPDLGAGDAATLVDQGAFDALLDLASAFPHVAAGTRARIVDAVSAGAASVATGAAALLEQQLRLASAAQQAAALAGADAAADEAVKEELEAHHQQLEVELGRHRAALKAYLWLSHALTVAADDEAASAAGAGPGKPSAAAAPPAAARSASWAAAWDGPCREATLHAALAALSLDLAALYRGLAAAERPVALALDMALRAAESPEAMRAGGGGSGGALSLADDPAATDPHAAAQLAASAPTARTAVVRLLALGAARYGQHEYVARQLVARARRHDHLPALAAAAAAHGEAALNSSALGVCLVAEFCRPSPRDYDAEAQRAAPGVKRAAELLIALAEAAPRTVANQMSTLQPYLACSAAATVRAAVVSAAGVALRRVYCPGAISAATAAGATRAHLRSKEHLLGLLSARVLDKAAYVRQRALRTWASLVDARCVPLSWWNAVLRAAVGRLEDESRLVSRDALGLLCRMVHANPFGPALETARFEATLALYEGQVQEAEARCGGGAQEGGGRRGRRGGQDGEDGAEGDEEEQGGGEEGGAAWARGDLRVLREGEQDEDEENDKSGGDGPSRPTAADEPASAADLPSDGDLQRLRHLVASLREAVAFCNALTAAMPAVRALLLAQASADSVQQAVVLLALCRRFRVPGAERALRAMWPLVFSREEAVRRAVLDAWHDLYVLVPTADVEAALERLGAAAGAGGNGNGNGGNGSRRGGGGSGGNAAAAAATVAAQLQAANLMDLTDGCSVGELDSLEAILAQLACPPDGSSPRLQARPLLLQVLAAAAAAKRAIVLGGGGSAASSRPADGDAAPRGNADQSQQQQQQQREQQEDDDESPSSSSPLAAARRTLARALALTALLAGARPAEVAPHAAVVVDVGLAAETGGRDPWVARNAALALARCAPAMLEAQQQQQVAAAAAVTTTAATTTTTTADASGGSVRRACAALARVLLSAPPTAAAADDWPAAAEACVLAIFALHPRPHALVGAVLRQLWRDCGLEAAGQRAAGAAAAAAGDRDGGGDRQADAMAAAAGSADPSALARLFFVLGQAALQQLLLAERAAKAARARRAAEDKAALSRAQRAMDAAADGSAGAAAPSKRGGGAKKAGKKAQQQQHDDDDDGDIAAQVLGAAGAPSGSAAEFDQLVDAAALLAEHQVLMGGEWGCGDGTAAARPAASSSSPLLLGAYAAVLSRYCHTRAMLGAPPGLQQAALLALSQLMAADARYCARHLPLCFTLLLRRLVPPEARCNLVVALSDLAGRFPNLLEPWTASLFAALGDGDGAVVRCALRALTHLALGGVVKPRGHVSRVAVLLVDADPEVRVRAAAFFAGLASTASGGGKRPGAAASAAAASASSGSAGAAAATNPVYNLLPDILSNLCRDETFSEDKFATVMSILLAYVKQDRQADSLRERLVARFDPTTGSGGGVVSAGGGGAGGPREWRMLAFCLASLGYSDRSARRMMDMLRCYRHALAEDAVFRVFATVCERAKKSAAQGTLAGGGGGKAAAGAAATAGGGDGGTDEGPVGAGAVADARERVAEYEAELLAARAQALEAREVEAAVAREEEAGAARAAAAADDDGGDGGAPDQAMDDAGKEAPVAASGAGLINLMAVAGGEQ